MGKWIFLLTITSMLLGYGVGSGAGYSWEFFVLLFIATIAAIAINFKYTTAVIRERERIFREN